LFGWLARKARMIPIDRGARVTSLARMTAATRREIADARQIVIFPEGTRQAPGAAPRYMPGVAYLYSEIGLPCVPVALNSGLYWPRRRFLRLPGKIRVEVLDPIQPGQDRNVFFAVLEERLEAATARLVAEGLRDLGETGRSPSEAAQSQA
jgi:1-acyl-sn-glycerol-3-phosphate acyltransferase